LGLEMNCQEYPYIQLHSFIFENIQFLIAREFGIVVYTLKGL